MMVDALAEFAKSCKHTEAEGGTGGRSEVPVFLVWFFNGFSMVFHGFSMVFHGFSMVFQWFFYGFSINLGDFVSFFLGF